MKLMHIQADWLICWILNCKHVSFYESAKEQNCSFLCDYFIAGQGVIYDVTMIIAQAYGLTTAILWI